MTTIPNTKDQLLHSLISDIASGRDHLDIHAIKTMLSEGADPTAVVDDVSAYDLIVTHNHDGKYNSILEEFDDFLDKKHLREHDSTYEGLEGKVEE